MSFEIGRTDGRSDAEVICDLVADYSPGTIIKYDEICNALSVNTDRTYEIPAAQSIVCRAEHKLATRLSRCLVNIRGQGYKIALAQEHQRIAGTKKDRAQKLLKRGVSVLKHVRWGEMDENQRRAHEGQLMILGALSSAMDGIEQRLRRVENAIMHSKSKP